MTSIARNKGVQQRTHIYMCCSSVCRLLYKSVPYVSAMTRIVSNTFYLFHFDIELCLFIWLKMHSRSTQQNIQCAVNWIECETDRIPTTIKALLVKHNCIELNQSKRARWWIVDVDDDDATTHNTIQMWTHRCPCLIYLHLCMKSN